uniref:Secreted protein n=1 Tax=Oryza brachyantha TaxID=4533 RepID=J3N204_ORYBR
MWWQSVLSLLAGLAPSFGFPPSLAGPCSGRGKLQGSCGGQLASWCFCSVKSEPLADRVRRRWETMTWCNLFLEVVEVASRLVGMLAIMSFRL